MQLDLSPTIPVQASPGAIAMAGELPSNIHFTLYAFQEDATAGRLFAIGTFEIHRIVDLASPCFIDVGAHVPHPGLHVSQYAKVIGQDTGITDVANPPPGATDQQKIEAATADQRQLNVTALAGDMGIRVVTSASIGKYGPVGADCNDTLGFPPPTCTDEPSNQRRLAMCQAAWQADPNYFEGTDRVLTQPLDGQTHGFVDGTNPINLAPVGGAQLYVDSVLGNFDGYAIYWQFDDADGDGKPDYPTGFPNQSQTGQLLLFGKPTMPTRDVIHVHLTSAASPGLTADLAIFSDLGQNDTSF